VKGEVIGTCFFSTDDSLAMFVKQNACGPAFNDDDALREEGGEFWGDHVC
jgi:hypothetical protein